MSSVIIPKPQQGPPLLRIRNGQSARTRTIAAWWYVLRCVLGATLIGLAISGCSSRSDTAAKAGPVTLVSGGTAQARALSLGSTTKLSMTPSGDSSNAGVDWIVFCGGNPISGSIADGACGTLSPVHTAGGVATLYKAPSLVPIGNVVTITASVTSNPSQSSSISLTILSVPIAISFVNPIPKSVEINQTISGLAVQVSNDPNAAGVSWTATCGSTACGSFNPTTSASSTVFTAPSIIPAGGTVTITATSLTDTTKSVSSIVAIAAPPPPDLPPPPPPAIAVSVIPSNVYVVQGGGAARSAHLTGVVSNDTGAGGIDWTLSCSTSNCGSPIAHSSSGTTVTFTNSSNIPAGGTITVTGRSKTDPTKSGTATVTVVATPPIVVTMTNTPPATLKTGSQDTLTATAAPNTGNAGVNWTASCGSPGGCGSFSLSPAHTVSGGSITYTAPTAVPDGSTVTIIASSAASTPSNPDVRLTTIVAQPPPPPTLSFVQAPPAKMASLAQAVVSATVAHDVATGGVTWAATCANTDSGGCGWFGSNQTASGASVVYTAPPVTPSGTAVTITATSVTDPSLIVSSDPITISPDSTLSVHFIPLLASLIQTNATANLNASVANDAKNSGIDWKVCASGCGFFTTMPAMPAVLATPTTPYVPAVPAVIATTVLAWPNGAPILYTAPSEVPSSGIVAILASAHADSGTENSGTIAVSQVSTGPALNGSVQAGSHAVAGSSVALYAAGTSGYASASTQIALASPTDKNGTFTVPAGYTCPQPGSQMYLLSTGGQVDTNEANPDLVLMTALGSCNTLGSGPVVLNEATTIASAWATSAFAANDALTGNNSYLYLGTSSTNLAGLANAFAAVNNLVDISTGKVRYTVPSGNASVPYVEINTLADFLNACAESSGGVEGDGSACGTLFNAADVLPDHSTYNSIAPFDTLQAAFNIAQHPAGNYGYTLGNAAALFALATSASPFQPILQVSPHDWSISLNYTGGGGLSDASRVGSFAIDAAGNLWITDTNAGAVIEWNSFGAAVSPSAGFAAGGAPIAIDATGNIWISGKGSLTELTNLGFPLPWSPYGGVAGGGGDLAFDAQSNLWITNTNGMNAFNILGQQLSPVDGFTNDGLADLTAVGIDSSNNVWVGTADAHIAELTNPGGQLVTMEPIQGTSIAPQIAADAVGNIWVTTPGSVCQVPPYGGKGSILQPVCYPEDQASPNGILLSKPRGIALDGAGVAWVAGQGGGTSTIGVILPPGVFPITPALSSPQSANALASSSLAAGPLRVAVDRAGNVWVLLANNTVTEYIGVATPVVTPLALGVQTGKLAVRP